MATLPLGQNTPYPDQYDPALLFPIPRLENRLKLGISTSLPLPFFGIDLWNAYELSWLNSKGKPQIALGEFQVPAESPNMIESKSLKLYLNSLNGKHFDSEEDIKACLITDLSKAAGTTIQVHIQNPEHIAKRGVKELTGQLIDRLDILIDPNCSADPALLSTDQTSGIIEQCLVSHLLKSNCPVTGQPDWASVQIHYRGRPILEDGLLRYLIGFRQLGEFHEHCVETIFCAINQQCKPEKLSVYARYTRRGG